MRVFSEGILVKWIGGGNQQFVGLVKKSNETRLIVETFCWGWNAKGEAYVGTKDVCFTGLDRKVDEIEPLI